MHRYMAYLCDPFDGSILQTRVIDADSKAEAISEAVRKFRWTRCCVHVERVYFQ